MADSPGAMDAREETLDILSKIWAKLQGLPNANAIDLGAFFILILFVLTFLGFLILACVQCCCCCCCGKGPRQKDTGI